MMRQALLMCPALRHGIAAAFLLAAAPAAAQTAANFAALRGLAPVSTLRSTPAGQAALAANFAITGDIQTGALAQPTLLPFPDQQRQALRDAFITAANGAQLADALGTLLGAAYQLTAHYAEPRSVTTASPATARLFAYTYETAALDAGAGKYFFANATTDGETGVAPPAAAILAQRNGETDVFGKAYAHPAGSPGADHFGNSRPYQTEPQLAPITGADYFGHPATNAEYLHGPVQDLADSPSFPSGHTTYGTIEAVLLGILVPERYQQQVVRAAEYGNSRILLGAHYAMDVIGGRTLALYDLAHLLANDPAYVGQARRRAAPIADYPAALAAARVDVSAALASGCGASVSVCAPADTSRFHDPAANAAFVAATQTYGLPVVHPQTAAQQEDVAALAPEAGLLLTAAFPTLSLAQADAILTATEGPGGGFLDDGSPFGLYSRLDLYAAVGQAVAQDATR